MSNFTAILFDGTTLANVRYRFYDISGTALASAQTSGISQNASGRPFFPITCTVPSGAVSIEIYDSTNSANWTGIALNFAVGDGATSILSQGATLTTEVAKIPKAGQTHTYTNTGSAETATVAIT